MRQASVYRGCVTNYPHMTTCCPSTSTLPGVLPYVYGVMLWYGRIIIYFALIPHMGRCFAPTWHPPVGHARSWAHTLSSSATGQQGWGAIPQREACCPPFIAVLRHVKIENAMEISHALCDAGFRMLSVTADTPGFQRILHDLASNRVLLDSGVVIGVSSVTRPQQVEAHISK